MEKSDFEALFSVQYRDNVTSRAGKFPLTTKDFYEIYTYISGEGPYFYFVNDKVYTVEPGTVLFIRPGVLIGNCKKEKARYTRLVCKLPVYAVDFISQLDPRLFAFLHDSDVSVFRPESEYRDEYFSYVDEMRALLVREVEHNKTLMFSVALRMLVLLSKISESPVNSQKSTSEDKLIAGIINTINKNYANLSSVAELADEMNYSKNYLSQYFKSHMDIGLHDFLIMKKLSVAAVKLISGKSVTDTAFECGFGSTAYFISVFKARYGMTPGKYISEKR